MSSPATPIIIGVGDIKNRSQRIEDALEPMELMFRAIQLALNDTSLAQSAVAALNSQIDDISIVRTWTWPYPDLPSLLSSKLNVDPKHKHYSPHGGNQPAKLLDESARRISKRECKVAVVTGGEALASLSSFAAAGQMPPPGWTKLPQDVTEVFTASGVDLGSNIGGVHGIGAPVQVYPLYENAFRAYRGQSVPENDAESAKLYASFSKIAEKNEFAWNYGKAETEEGIKTVSRKNRMICFPYPLLMNAFNTVNLAGAVILTSTEYAKELGILESKWIYPLGGAGTSDSDEFWLRPSYYHSPCISTTLTAALAASAVPASSIDLYDFYSCFPIVPKLACAHLNLSISAPEKPISLLGGLTSFGGAGNNYSLHAITALVRRLRSPAPPSSSQAGPTTGLVLANGGVLTYQHAVVLSRAPRQLAAGPYPASPPLPASLTAVPPADLSDDLFSSAPPPRITTEPQGRAVIETWTVAYGRSGRAEQAFVVGRLVASGERFVANDGDGGTLRVLGSGGEMVGREGWVEKEKGGERNLFWFGTGRERL